MLKFSLYLKTIDWKFIYLRLSIFPISILGGINFKSGEFTHESCFVGIAVLILQILQHYMVN